jgi:hypothetical protein
MDDPGLKHIAGDSMARANLAAALAPAIPGLDKLVDDPSSIWIRTKAAEALARLGGPSERAVAMLRELFTPEETPVKFSDNNSGVKNAAARTAAAEGLGLWGKAAAAAIPALDVAASLGKQAAAAVKVIDGLREAYGKQSGKSSYDYVSQLDPAAVAVGKPVLEAGATKGSEAQRALDFLTDAKSPDLSKVSPLRMRDLPLVESTLRNLVQIGEVAAKARSLVAK